MLVNIIAATDYQSDTTPPVITSAAVIEAVESVALAHALTADEDATFTITGGADAALFEIDGGVLQFIGGTPTTAAPTDADANGIYLVEVTADDGLGNVSDPQAITVYVTDASGWFVAFNAGTPSGSTGSVGNANTRQRISTPFRRGSDSLVRVTFAAAESSQLAIAHAAIGVMAPWFGSSPPDTYDMNGGQVALPFGGNPNTTVSAGGSVVSDAVTFSFLASDILIFPIHHQNATSAMRKYSIAGSATPQLVNAPFLKETATDESLVSDVSGYAFFENAVYGVSKIEVKQA